MSTNGAVQVAIDEIEVVGLMAKNAVRKAYVGSTAAKQILRAEIRAETPGAAETIT